MSHSGVGSTNRSNADKIFFGQHALKSSSDAKDIPDAQRTPGSQDVQHAADDQTIPGAQPGVQDVAGGVKGKENVQSDAGDAQKVPNAPDVQVVAGTKEKEKENPGLLQRFLVATHLMTNDMSDHDEKSEVTSTNVESVRKTEPEEEGFFARLSRGSNRFEEEEKGFGLKEADEKESESTVAVDKGFVSTPHDEKSKSKSTAVAVDKETLTSDTESWLQKIAAGATHLFGREGAEETVPNAHVSNMATKSMELISDPHVDERDDALIPTWINYVATLKSIGAPSTSSAALAMQLAQDDLQRAVLKQPSAKTQLTSALEVAKYFELCDADEKEIEGSGKTLVNRMADLWPQETVKDGDKPSGKVPFASFGAGAEEHLNRFHERLQQFRQTADSSMHTIIDESLQKVDSRLQSVRSHAAADAAREEQFKRFKRSQINRDSYLEELVASTYDKLLSTTNASGQRVDSITTFEGTDSDPPAALAL